MSPLGEIRSFAKFFAIILLLASEGVEKRFGETVYKKDKDKKKKPRDVKIAFVIRKTPKPQDTQNHNSLY